MRLHHYPGLFGDPRTRGLRMAVGVSLAVHVLLFAAVGQMRTRVPERTFFAPVHIVDLVERSPGPAAKPTATAPATPKPPTASPAKAAPEAPVQPPPEKPAPAKKQSRVTRESVERLLSKPPEVQQPAAAQEPATEERISERIAKMREKYAAAPPTAAAPEPAGGVDSGRSVQEAIASIRQRVGPAAAGQEGAGSDRKVGVRGGGTNTLQQVRLRAYYNQLWDHVTSHWAIPPSLQGRDYSVIVSVILDRRGTLVRSWVEEPSGSDAFDQSALRALQRAQPLPPIPDSVSGDTLEVGFRFHPD